MLVSESKAEINAGFVAVAPSISRSHIDGLSPDAAVERLTQSRETMFRHSARPQKETDRAMTGLLVTPLLGRHANRPGGVLHFIGEWMAKHLWTSLQGYGPEQPTVGHSRIRLLDVHHHSWVGWNGL